MSRLIGLGLTLIKNYELKDESLNSEFIVKSYSYKDDIETDRKNVNSFKNLKQENKKIKDNVKTKTQTDEKKKELPPLPDLKIKGKSENNIKISSDNESNSNKQKDKINNEDNKPFKMDKSFLKND